MRALWRDEMLPQSGTDIRDPCWVATRSRFGQSHSRDIPSGSNLMPQGCLVLDMPSHALPAGRVIAQAGMKDHFLRLEAAPEQGVFLDGRVFGADWKARLRAKPGAASGRRLLQLSWDAASHGMIALSDWPYTSSQKVAFSASCALPAPLMRALLNGVVAPDTGGALALHSAPLEARPMLPPDARLQTRHGTLRADQLKSGAELSTLSGRSVRLLAATPISMPPLGPWRPLELRAPYFEADAPLRLPKSQKILLHGPDIQYMFDINRAVLPLAHLREGKMVRHLSERPVWDYIALTLERSCALRVNGVPLEMQGLDRPRPLPQLTTQDLQSLWQFRGL